MVVDGLTIDRVGREFGFAKGSFDIHYRKIEEFLRGVDELIQSGMIEDLTEHCDYELKEIEHAISKQLLRSTDVSEQ